MKSKRFRVIVTCTILVLAMIISGCSSDEPEVEIVDEIHQDSIEQIN